MRLVDLTLKILGISETIHRWQDSLVTLETARRVQIAKYADEIAATLARSAAAFASLERDPADIRSAREAIRELGRITGYVEDIVATLEDHLDGRKLAGVKRRLEPLAELGPLRQVVQRADSARIENLLEAEGYFRALADGLRT